MSTPKIPIDAETEVYQKTLAQTERIQSRINVAPRSGRLKDNYRRRVGEGDRVRSPINPAQFSSSNSLTANRRASAILFAHQGARHLYLLDYASENLPELKQTIEKAYPDVKATVVQADAVDEEAIKGLCNRTLEEEGRLDVFVANAGIADMVSLDDITGELHADHASEHLEYSEGGGSIILTASVAGLKSDSVSKAVINSMAQTAAYQFAGRNIRVNSICPGFIETEMTDGLFAAGASAIIGQLNPLRRHGIPEEIAQAALYLAPDESSFVNAQTFAVDGGMTGLGLFQWCLACLLD